MSNLFSVKPQIEKIAHNIWTARSEINIEETTKQIRILRGKDTLNGFVAGIAVASTAISLVIIKSNQ